MLRLILDSSSPRVLLSSQSDSTKRRFVVLVIGTSCRPSLSSDSDSDTVAVVDWLGRIRFNSQGIFRFLIAIPPN